MYGMDGNYSALDWAEEYGLEAVSEEDRKKLVERDYFTVDGQRTDKTNSIKQTVSPLIEVTHTPLPEQP
jgi:hypothetical protein